MKTRNGFVSNSSSSSFLIAFDKVPETAEEMAMLLFGKSEGEITHEDYPTFDVLKLAEIVLRDIQERGAGPLNERRWVKVLNEGSPLDENGRYIVFSKTYVGEDVKRIVKSKNIEIGFRTFFPGENGEYVEAVVVDLVRIPDVDFGGTPESRQRYHKAWDQYHRRHVVLAKKYIDEVLRGKFRGKKVYRVEYADSGSYGSFLEHANVFRRIPHIRISKH